MSLINKMLVDLEARKEGAAIVQPIYDDLRPAVGARPAPALVRYRAVFAALGACAVLVGLYALSRPQPAALDAVATVAQHAPLPAAQPRAPDSPRAVASAPANPLSPPSVAAESAPSAEPPVTATAGDLQTKAPSAHASVAVVVPASRAAAAAVPSAPAPSSKPPSSKSPSSPAVDATAVAADSARQDRGAATASDAAKNPTPAVKVAARSELPARASSEVKIEKTTRVVTPRERAVELHRTAGRQRQRGDVHAAEASLRAALAQDATLTAARSDLVALQMERGRISEALALLHDGLMRTPAHYAFAQLAARLYVEQGSDAQALAVLEASRAHAARDANYLGFLAALYQRAQRYADAAAAYDAALGLRPQEARWWVGSGIVREAQGDTAGAKLAYTRAQGSPALPPALVRFVQERLTALKGRAS